MGQIKYLCSVITYSETGSLTLHIHEMDGRTSACDRRGWSVPHPLRWNINSTKVNGTKYAYVRLFNFSLTLVYLYPATCRWLPFFCINYWYMLRLLNHSVVYRRPCSQFEPSAYMRVEEESCKPLVFVCSTILGHNVRKTHMSLITFIPVFNLTSCPSYACFCIKCLIHYVWTGGTSLIYAYGHVQEICNYNLNFDCVWIKLEIV